MADSTHLGSQNKLTQQAKGRVRDVVKLKLQCELFPPLMLEGSAGEKQRKRSKRTPGQGSQGATIVQECGHLCTSTLHGLSTPNQSQTVICLLFSACNTRELGGRKCCKKWGRSATGLCSFLNSYRGRKNSPQTSNLPFPKHIITRLRFK